MNGQPFSEAARATTSRAATGIAPHTTGRPSFTIPAFSSAIIACVVPSQSQWSRPMRVITETSVVATTFVAS